VIQEQKLSHYINKAKFVDTAKYEKKIRIALLGSFTLNGIEETLRAKCSEIQVGCISYIAGYNQYNQEILNKQSNLYNFAPDVVFLILDVRSILGKLFHLPYSITESERRQFIENKVLELSNLIKFFVENSKAKLVFTNLSVPTYSPYGIYETKISYGLQEMVDDYNRQISTVIKNMESAYLYNFDSFVTKLGEKNVFDYKQFFIGDIQISFDCIPYLTRDFVGYIKAVLGMNKKCIVLDLDNTLWGGIVGEDGFEGIKLGSDPVGKAFVEFQKTLLALHKRGIILAINSKNNFDDAIHVIRDHSDMILREEHFSCMKINWNDKTQNMKEIANELNIGLDSMVFFDDDPVNREYMRTNFPQILTAEMPQDVAQYAPLLMSLNDFDTLKITEEDLSRGSMYVQEKQRKDLQQQVSNLDTFLEQLKIKLKIKNANDFTIPRISQLTLKTNQFNLTTKRYQNENIKKFIDDGDWVGCAQVEDKFGDSGITGVFIVKKNPSEWLIDTFLLSCRIMGRGIEDGILAEILKKAKEAGIKTVLGEFIPTKKNTPCADFFANYGFKQTGRYWAFDTSNPIKIPKHLDCSVEQ